MTSARNLLGGLLTELLPKSWPIIRHSRSLEVHEKTVVMLKQQNITRHAANPGGALLVEFTVTIITAYTDPATAEDDLDTTVLALATALDYAGILWRDAAKKEWDESHLCYDLTVEIILPNP